MLFGLNRRKAERYAGSHLCEHCRAHSVLAHRWNQAMGQYEVYCPPCGNASEFARIPSMKEKFLADPESVTAAEKSTLARKYRKDIEAMAAALPEELARQVRERYGLQWLTETREGE